MEDMARRAEGLEEIALGREGTAQLAQITEDMRSLREKLKFIKGDIFLRSHSGAVSPSAHRAPVPQLPLFSGHFDSFPALSPP